MSPETLQALRDSISHWEENAKAEFVRAASTGSDACALCHLFIDDNCAGCPVAIATKTQGCCDTPWHTANTAWRRWYDGITGAGPAFRIAAQAEVEFLKSPLPETSND